MENTIHEIEKFFQSKFPEERIDHRWPVACNGEIDWEDIFQTVIDFTSRFSARAMTEDEIQKVGDILCHVAQLIQGWNTSDSDSAWSEWDQSVYNEVVEFQKHLLSQGNKEEKQLNEEETIKELTEILSNIPKRTLLAILGQFQYLLPKEEKESEREELIAFGIQLMNHAQIPCNERTNGISILNFVDEYLSSPQKKGVKE